MNIDKFIKLRWEIEKIENIDQVKTMLLLLLCEFEIEEDERCEN
jgi:hypothetical protein